MARLCSFRQTSQSSPLALGQWCPKAQGAPVFRQTSQNSPLALGLTAVTQVLVMTWQCASPSLELRTQLPSFTLYAWPATPVTLYRGWQLQKLTDLAARAAHGAASDVSRKDMSNTHEPLHQVQGLVAIQTRTMTWVRMSVG